MVRPMYSCATVIYLLKILASYSLVFLLGYLPEFFVQLFGFIREL